MTRGVRRSLLGALALLLAAAVVALAVAVVSDTTAADAAPCGGERPGRSGGGTWTCSFSDDFSGDTLDRGRWVVQETATSAYQSGGECFVDSPDTVSVSDGLLHLTVLDTGADQPCPGGQVATTRYRAGMVSTTGTFAQTYGRFEIRARFPDVRVPGVHSALWLYPQTLTYGAWPASGEIDVGERYTSYPDLVVPYLHYPAGTRSEPVTSTTCAVPLPDRFHTYALVWTAQRITISYDGRTCLSAGWQAAAPLAGRAPFDRPFFVALTQAIGLAPNAVDPARPSPLPATMDVDWVRVYR